MGAKVQCENYFQVVFPNTNAGLDAGVNRSLIEAWPDCAGEETLKEKQFYSTLKQGTMAQCSENDFEILKHTMLKHEEVFRDQVHELHRLYQVQKLLMAELKKKDSNTSTLTCEPVQDGPFPMQVGSEPLESEEKSSFWGALGSSMTDKDGRDCRQNISGVDYMQNHRSSLFEKNLQLGLIPQGGNRTSRDIHNLQPSRARKWTFDLEQPADEYMDDEVANKNEEAKTLKREVKDVILEPGSLNYQSTTEPETEVQLTLKTGCEQGGRKNGRQNGAFIKLGIPEISKDKLEEHKQLRRPEEALFFPATSSRSDALSQEAVGRKMPVLSNQCFSRGPFNFDQEYKINAEWPSVSRTMSFQEQRESRYPWPKEGIYPGTVPQQLNSFFSLASAKGLDIDPSPTSKEGSLLCVSPKVITNSQKELHSTRPWRQACIPPETDSQKQNFDLQDKYLAQPYVNSASNVVNVKQKTSEPGMGTWYQNGNPVQHTHQQSQSTYNAGNPSIFGQSLCQTSPTIGFKTSQQQGAVLAFSASAPSSLAFPLHSLQECSRSVWATDFVGLSPAQGLEGLLDVDGKRGKEVDLTLGLSSGTMEDSRKDLHYCNATNKTEVAFINNNGQFEITNRHIHRDSMHLNGEVQRGQCFARNFIELPYTEMSSDKHLSEENGLEFSELLKSSSQGLLCRTGRGMVSTKQLADNLGEGGVSPSKKRISLVSDLLKDHDITNGDKGLKSDVLHVTEKGMHKSKNIFDFIDTTMNNSTAVLGTFGNSLDFRTGKNHSDKHWIVPTDPPKHEMKIETFKENINAVYGSCRGEELSANNSKQTFITENKFMPSTNKNVGEKLWEGTSLTLEFRVKGNGVEGSRQLEMEDRFALNNCSKARRVSTSGKTVPLTQDVSTGKFDKDGEKIIKFSPQFTISDINDGFEVTREGSSCTNNALLFDREKENDSEETFCCTTKKIVMTKDDTKKDVQSKEIDYAETSSGIHKANAQLPRHDRDLENCSRYTDVQRSSESNFESEVDTFQINATNGLSSSCSILENKRIGKSASRDSSINMDAANCLLKISSEKSSDRLGLDSLEFILASGVKSSLDWFADTVVSNADISVSTSVGHQEEADNPVSSSRSGSKAKRSEISEVSVPKENDCSPHASNALDFFESMTLMLEECNVDLDFKVYVSQEKESEKPSSPMNSMLKPPKRGKRRRDFQREILPSISSLSRQEITEDMQIIGGLIRSTGDAWHTGSTRRGSGKFSMTDDWFLPLTGRRSRNTSGFRANGGNMKRNNDCQTTRPCDQEVERLNTLSWTSSWGDTIRRRRMQRPRVSLPSLALNPV
ncbi:uncharacterized protein LOC131056777 isoform X2 [Cryptomeria japonica]|nr:uncharacterized protein LOC131056777 isoform X2 [Cryptomeria japonica]XP_057847021.2 uncharacterized protein LOC131056777 isoform X2 [Cryptomeria japonica]